MLRIAPSASPLPNAAYASRAVCLLSCAPIWCPLLFRWLETRTLRATGSNCSHAAGQGARATAAVLHTPHCERAGITADAIAEAEPQRLRDASRGAGFAGRSRSAHPSVPASLIDASELEPGA